MIINPPTTVEVDSVLTTSLSFSWSEATCPGPCPNGITGYTYRLMEVVTTTEIDGGTTDADERFVTVSGLVMCTEYSFYVAGNSGNDIGSYSDEKAVTTFGQGMHFQGFLFCFVFVFVFLTVGELVK